MMTNLPGVFAAGDIVPRREPRRLGDPRRPRRRQGDAQLAGGAGGGGEGGGVSAPIALVAVSNDKDRQESAKTGKAEQTAAALSGLLLAKLLLPEEVVKAQSGGIYAAFVDTLVARQGGLRSNATIPG